MGNDRASARWPCSPPREGSQAAVVICRQSSFASTPAIAAAMRLRSSSQVSLTWTAVTLFAPFTRAARCSTPRNSQRDCPAYRAWVRRHRCCVVGCLARPIECAHVRAGTDGGVGLKPSDRWTISLCAGHHAEQHLLGHASFEQKYCLDLKALAQAFARASPHRLKVLSNSATVK
ncbi:MAG: putative HNHc nuclease [Sphingomicrobium sp.]